MTKLEGEVKTDDATVDICDRCGEEFGLSGEDSNGYNSSCVHCGNNTYTSHLQKEDADDDLI